MKPDVVTDRLRWLGWLAVVLPPAAWSAMLSLHLMFVDVACIRHDITPMLIVSVVCAFAVIVGGVLCVLGLREIPAEGETNKSSRFMLMVGAWEAPLFVLVIVASTVPVYLLSPCPT